MKLTLIKLDNNLKKSLKTLFKASSFKHFCDISEKNGLNYLDFQIKHYQRK